MAKSLWKLRYIITAYELAKNGLSEAKIAKALGISFPTFLSWEKKKPAFKMAVESGRRIYKGRGKHTISFRDYVFQRLPKNLRILWRKINKLDDSPSGYEKIQALLADRGVSIRQHLFVYAWTDCNFSISNALRKVCISRATFDKWRNEDPEFAMLIKEIDECKKDFFEDHLCKLIAGGDATLTKFANETYNRDRGYGRELNLNLDVSGTIQHNVVSINHLKLPIKTRKALLKSLRLSNKDIAS